MIVSAAWALVISIGLVLLLVRLRVHVGIAILAGAFALAFLASGLRMIATALQATLLDINTWRLVVIVACAMGLSAAMDELGLLKKLARSLESIGSKASLYLIPAVIGLVPMPAGALVSATMVRDIAWKWKLSPEEATFINYWFRHIIEYSWPVYQSIILTSVIFSLSIEKTIRTLFPMTLVNALIGLLIGYFIFKNKEKPSSDDSRLPAVKILFEFTRASWPILLLIVLIMVFKLDAAVAFVASLATLLATSKLNRKSALRVLRSALNPSIIILLIAVMMYKNTIERVGAARSLYTLLSAHGIPPLMLVVILPLIVGFATGISIAFVGITLPLLAPIITRALAGHNAILLAYASGMSGILLTPLHLCLILSVEYFKASLTRTYKYLVPAVALSETIALTLYFLT